MKITASLFLATAGCLAQEPDWTPVPKSAWTLTEADAQGTGAVIVERRLFISNQVIKHRLRVRVLSEGGKSAVTRLRLPAAVANLKGRVTYPGGGEQPLDPAKDLVQRKVKVSERLEMSETLLAPAGLTADCLVDLGWDEPQTARHGTFTTFTSTQPPNLQLALDHPILKEIVTIPKNFRFAYKLEGWTDARPYLGREDAFVLQRVPAAPHPPFAIPALLQVPRLVMFQVPTGLRAAALQGPDAFWAEAGRTHYRSLFEGVEAGPRYQAWAGDLLKGLPAAPQEAAYELALRLDARIRNTSRLTFQEAAAQPRKEDPEKVSPRNLDEVVKAGRTDAWGMLHLYLRLLGDAGIQARVVFAANRDRGLIDRTRLDVNQWTDILVGIREAGKTDLMVAAYQRFAQPGLVEAGLQGMPALAFVVGTWTPEWTAVPIQGGRTNVSRFTCRLELGEDVDRFTVEGGFSGLVESWQRHRFMALEPASQARDLRESLESGTPSVRITQAEVENALDNRKNVAWRIQGTVEREPGRRAILDPFPCVPAPLPVPKAWPATRKDSIGLPNLGIHIATCSFPLPAGWRLLPTTPMDHHNTFGSVSWAQKQVDTPAGPEVQVTFRVETTLLLAKPEAYDQLKEFVGWMAEGYRRAVVLERS